MIQIQNLTKSFHTKTLFRDVTYQFPAGEKVALVGANGAGKTTLLNILCSRDTADDGFVRVPERCIVGYLPQEPNPHPKGTVRDECVEGASHLTQLKVAMDRALAAMETDANSDVVHAFEAAETAFRTAGGYAIEAKADRVLTGLGFSPAQLIQNPKELSGGWRMRLELAKLFLREPDFLILDEPTNHLDLPSLVWVEGYLQNFPGTLLFVSHDRALLNRLSTITLHMEGGTLKSYTGNFDSFLEQREQHLEQEMKTAEGLRKRREHMEKFVERFGAKASKAKQAQSRQKMIARIRDVEMGMQSDISQETMGIVIPEPPRSPRIACEVRGGAIGYNSTLAAGIELMVEKGAKVAIIGANGIGKSTFLKTLAGILPARDGDFAVRAEPFAYFAQDQLDVLTPEKSVLENLLARSSLGEPAARSLLGGLLFHGDDVFKPVKVLSGGEKSRVGLAAALAQKAACLMLDEPTNHLDMASVESLADGLSQYSGTVLFVSHDRQFIDDLSTHVFVMLPDGRSQLFIGKIEDYRRNAAQSGFPDIFIADAPEDKTPEPTSAGAARPDYGDRKEKKKLKQKLASQSAKLESEMDVLRRQIASLDERLAGAGAADLKTITSLHKEKTDLESQLEATEETWLGVAEELDTLDL